MSSDAETVDLPEIPPGFAAHARSRGCHPFDGAAAARRYPACPLRFIESLERFVNYGIRCGQFLTAVLENDLTGALSRADDEAVLHLRDIHGVVFNFLPTKAWGSKTAVAEWLRRKEVPNA